MATIAMKNVGTVVLAEQKSGYSVVHKGTPLTHLNYFDGMFMRAEHLKLEQAGLRSLTHLSNQAGGHGVVYGYDTSLANGGIRLGQGMAIDFAGRVVYLPDQIDIAIDDLITRSATSNVSPSLASSGLLDGVVTSEFDDCIVSEGSEPGTVIDGVAYYIVTVGHIEGLCGEEDVFGRLCEEACITASDRPYMLEGVIVRAEPFPSGLVLPGSSAEAMEDIHLRSRIASAYFEYERKLIADQISAEGLAKNVWCQGARLPGGITAGVPVALLARAGGETLFLDRWIVGRERMEAPPKRYWAHIMTMRPWNIFLAQVLQFQCHLNNLFQGGGGSPKDDPCAESRGVMRQASEKVAGLLKIYEETSRRFIGREIAGDAPQDAITLGLKTIEQALAGGSLQAELPANRLLIHGGIVELPSAGYLPVKPDDKLTVNEQVRRMMGEGVDLRFCIVRPDYVAHALEEAQHMERISLLKGLDDPTRKPKVDILVPEGEIAETSVVVTGTGYEMTLDLSPIALQIVSRTLTADPGSVGGGILRPDFMRAISHSNAQLKPLSFSGAARGEQLPGGGFGFHYAGAFKQDEVERPPAFTLIELLQHAGIWITAELDRDPYSMSRNESTRLNGEMTVLVPGTILRTVFNGDLQLVQSQKQSDRHQLSARLTASLTTTVINQASAEQKTNVFRLSDRVDIGRVSDDRSKPSIEVDFPTPGLLGAAQRLFRFDSARRWSSAVKASVDGGISKNNPDQPAAPSFTLIELNQEIPLFAVSQTVNPAVLAPAHSAHESAITALRAIGTALKEPQFEEISVRKLFPPPKSGVSDVQVRASRDWVLFHRRRDIQCAGDKAPVPELSTRKYRTYVVNLPSESVRETLHQGLVNNDAGIITKLNPVQVGLVEFAAGIQTLESPADVIRAEWQGKATVSGEIVYAAVASTGDVLDEGVALSRARLASLSNVLSAVTPLSDDQQIETLQSIPDAAIISAAPHDGVMVFATAPLVTICHQVFRLKATKQIVTRLLRSIASTGAATIAEVLEKMKLTSMGRAVFKEGEKEIVESASEDLKQAWSDQGGGEVGRVILVSQRPANPGTPTEAEKTQIELFVNQASTIAQTVGTEIPPNQVTVRPPEDAEPLNPCPVITIVVNLTD